MHETARLKVEKELATARRAIYRAISVAEMEAAYGLEDDLHQAQVALGALMDDVMRNRVSMDSPELRRTHL